MYVCIHNYVNAVCDLNFHCYTFIHPVVLITQCITKYTHYNNEIQLVFGFLVNIQCLL